MPLVSEARLLDACQLLFGHGVQLDRNFLAYLQPSGAKAAYRRRAKEFHPDLHATASPAQRKRHTDHFRQLVAAHELLCEFFRQRGAGMEKPSAPPAPASDRAAAAFYRGAIPGIQLTIGRYCYYRGMIPYAVLIEALAWQRRQRPVLGELARSWGWLSEAGVRNVLNNADVHGKFGERAVALGVLDAGQVRALLRYQRRHQARLGSYFVQQGHLSETSMTRLTREMRLHNAAVFTGRQPPV